MYDWPALTQFYFNFGFVVRSFPRVWRTLKDCSTETDKFNQIYRDIIGTYTSCDFPNIFFRGGGGIQGMFWFASGLFSIAKLPT